MKKFVITFLSLLLAITSVLSLSSCGKRDGFLGLFGNKIKRFGVFGSFGEFLAENAIEEISANQAKELIQANATTYSQNISSFIPPTREGNLPLPSDDYVAYFMSTYADCTAVTTYYVDDDKEETKDDFIQGTDFKAILEDNAFTPFNQLLARIVIVFPEIIDYMENENAAFKKSDAYDVAPFKTLFSYHTNKDGNLVIQCRDFSEIPASEAGGVGCSFRQDTEIVFGNDNKVVLWQTSLGVYTSSPTGTIEQGYILKVEFNWHEKQ